MRSVAIVLDGILRKPLDVEAQDVGGALLYAGLADNFRLVVLGTDNFERDNQFLLINGMTRHVKVEGAHPGDRGIRDQLRRLRAEGFVFEFVLLPDPDLAVELVHEGFPVLLYCHPRFSPPEAKRLTPWADLASRVESDRLARAEAAAK